MSIDFTFKKGDLIGINNGAHIEKFLIAQVIRENRFFYCLCLDTRVFHFLVYDPKHHFLLCPDFDLEIEPDIDVLSMGVEFYEALDRLFGYTDD
tara:strand:- start:192 stop:473 length:282 start_codon:yes stop_codon:yes gene_type:complete